MVCMGSDILTLCAPTSSPLAYSDTVDADATNARCVHSPEGASYSKGRTRPGSAGSGPKYDELGDFVPAGAWTGTTTNRNYSEHHS